MGPEYGPLKRGPLVYPLYTQHKLMAHTSEPFKGSLRTPSTLILLCLLLFLLPFSSLPPLRISLPLLPSLLQRQRRLLSYGRSFLHRTKSRTLSHFLRRSSTLVSFAGNTLLHLWGRGDEGGGGGACYSNHAQTQVFTACLLVYATCCTSTLNVSGTRRAVTSLLGTYPQHWNDQRVCVCALWKIYTLQAYV